MWAAANSASRPQDSDWDSESSGERSTTESIVDTSNAATAAAGQGSRKRRKKKKQRREETPEAAVARLTSSYSAAMGAVGALYRFSRELCNESIAADDNNEANSGEDAAPGDDKMETESANEVKVDATKVISQDAMSDDMQIDGEKASDATKDTSTSKLEESKAAIRKVAQSARSSLEQSLLLDPIIMAPILLPSGTTNSRIAMQITDKIPVEQMTSAWHTIYNASNEVTKMHKQSSVSKWKKLSAAHKSTVKQIAYLSLVNYADLLLCGCSCCHSGNGDMLDRRTVQSLDALRLFQDNDVRLFQDNDDMQRNQHAGCLWDESKEQTLRLVLASYCDASELDSSDPTLWFKVACTARALGRVVDSNKLALDAWRPMSYRSLERLALERGLNALPKGMPPNRMLMRARREMERWDRSHGNQVSEESDSVMSEETSDEPIKLVVHLPDNSWTTLGRILIRACKEGAGFGRSGPVSHVWSTNCKTPEDYEFGSPLMDIRISPLLCLPDVAMSGICGYLGKDSHDAKSLACTCKALPSKILSALSNISISHDTLDGSASNDKDSYRPNADLGSTTSEVAPEQPKPVNETPADNPDRSNDLTIDVDATNDNATVPSMTSPKLNRSSSNSPRPVIPGERVSKRVRSQMLTSEKETERQAKRSSVEHCLLAGALSCTAQNPTYAKMSKTEYEWDQLPVFESLSNKQIESSTVIKTADKVMTTSKYRAPSSLSQFISVASKNNSGPRHLLELFLIYVAMNPNNAFQDGKNNLSACFLDCFDLLAFEKEGYLFSDSDSSWYGNEEPNGMNEKCIYETIAVNLLSAELRLKRTSKRENATDAQTLASAIPTLLKFVTLLPTEGKGDQMRTSIELSCRCHWLGCEYYFWLSRSSNDSLVSVDAERLGLECLVKAQTVLSSNGGSAIEILTPHLVAPHREGRYWSVLSVETLSAYNEELQSSSVVSRARSEFVALGQTLQIDSSVDYNAKLTTIGIDLFDWYCKGDGTSKGSFIEIVNDFIVQHQDLLGRTKPTPTSTTNAKDWLGKFYWGEALWNCVPSSLDAGSAHLASAASSRPSICQVFVCSLLATREHAPSTLVVFAQLALAALQMRARLDVVAEKSVGGEVKERVESELESSNAQQDELLLTAANYFFDKLIDLLNYQDISIVGAEAIDALREVAYASVNALPSRDQSYPSLTKFHYIQSLSRCVFALRLRKQELETIVRDVECTYFATLVKEYTSLTTAYLRLALSDKDKRTKSCQTQLSRTADFVAHVENELAECLSLNPTTINSDGTLILSPLIKAIGPTQDTGRTDYVPVVKLYQSALWFWKHGTKKSDKVDVIRLRLLKPTAALIASLCGAFGVSVGSSQSDENDGFSDYFDSDDSVNGSFLRDVEKDNNIILRQLKQLVQCISLVYSVGEKSVGYEYAPFMSPSNEHGPFLHLVVLRVLSSISDNLFHLFSQDIWNDQYPYGARSCGIALDSMLASVYRTVYGISLICQTQTGTDSSNDTAHLPESLDSAARLFRCVKRLYRRKTLPVRALELIDKVLPPSQETPVNAAIRTFMFDGNSDTELCQCAHEPPGNFPEWILNVSQDNQQVSESESDRLRKLVSSELAKGSISQLDSSQVSSDGDDSGLTEERELTRSHELSLYNKFRVLLDDLSVNPSNIENWVVLSETCGFKADIIIDRLVTIKEPFNLSKFRPQSSSMKAFSATMELDDLKQSQLQELNESLSNWIPFLGNDLSVYMQYPWSSFTSLQACAKDIESKLNADDSSVFKDLEIKFKEGNFVSWANSWAGMFVLALRKMKIRSLLVARYLAKKNKQNGELHPSDISEDLGTALYVDLVGSTRYGYPIRAMSDYEKREVAQSAKSFFEETIALSTSTDFSCKCETVLWENQFMIGKCYEKIASTLCGERDDKLIERSYETTLKSALQSYSGALTDAKEREQSGGKRENGGSSHGSLEVFYRIHACRLKTLLFSFCRVKEEQNDAMLEALRIVSTARFGDSFEEQTPSTLRNKVWNAFVDCVRALMQCRSDEPKFHRAVFRLAQAFNWAPMVHDPANFVLGSGGKRDALVLDGVSLPYIEAGSCEQNAALAIESLFDKRRSQLCAVWVTTSTTPPPFEVINDSVRKYDYLRLKYIKSYIDCMKRTKQMNKIETLLNYTTNCAQDLAGFYQASAAVRGMDPGRHTKLSLLKTSGFLSEVKRSASIALSELLLGDLAYLKQHRVDINGKAALDACFKLSNSLFLRMNSPPNEAVQHMIANGSVIQVGVLCKCFISIQAGYRINDSIRLEELDKDTLLSFVEQALQKAKDMFPTKSKLHAKK